MKYLEIQDDIYEELKQSWLKSKFGVGKTFNEYIDYLLDKRLNSSLRGLRFKKNQEEIDLLLESC